MTKNQIPTAIVKPKYQRSSFDDRQLPAVAYMNDDKMAWYDKQTNTPETASTKCSASVVTVPPHPKKIHLPEFDRKAKKHMKSMTTMMSNAKSAHNAVDNSTTAHNNPTGAIDNTKSSSDGKESLECADTNRSVVPKPKKTGASVAVVQPRKKERMDERKLMETIVQMQIKKNALLYSQGKLNNNNNNAVGNSDKGSSSSSSTAMPRGTSVVNQTNVKHSNNNNHTVNNNNGENCTERSHAKKDQKENSGMESKVQIHNR